MISEIAKNLKIHENFPRQGISFIDISSILNNKDYFKFIIDALHDNFKDKKIDKVVAVEARGFIFGAALAYLLNCGFVMIRKKGKLAGQTIQEEYIKEYGKDILEVQADCIKQNEKVVLIDDVLATGGTLVAGINLLERLNANIVDICCIIEIEKLNGRNAIKNNAEKITSLIKI